jgi:putative ABC transport system ATP-binding protein
MATITGNGKSPLAPVWQFLSTERESVWIILAHACGVGLLSLALPVAIQSLVNTVAFGSVLQPILVLTLVVVACMGASAILKLMQTLAAEMLQRRIFVRFSLLIASRLPNLRSETHRSVNVQETVNRFFDIFLVQKALAFLLLEGVGLVLQAGIGLVLLAFYHPFLLAFGGLLVASLAFVCFILGSGAVKSAIQESSAKYEMAAWLEEMARIPRSLNSIDGNRQAVERADRMASVWLNARERHFRKIFSQTLGTLVLQVLASGILLGFGGWLVIRKELSLGQLVAAELIVTGVLYSISKMGKQFEAFYDVVAGLNKIEGILDLPVESSEGRKVEDDDGAWSVGLNGVSLRDPDSARHLHDITIDIPRGSKVLIVGSGGSGKSLLAGLFFGSIRPDSGQVLLQGQDLRYLAPLEMRRRVRLVGELELIDGTIEENLLLGNSDAGLHDFDRALRAVKLDSTVAGLREGLMTRLNIRGAPLTYSQARKLMLARAVLGRPGLVILDKNSDWLQSPVPGASTSELLRGFFQALGDCTVVVLAEPDFATDELAREFDLKLVLSEGRLSHA